MKSFSQVLTTAGFSAPLATHATTFTVITTADSSPVSLRQAIWDANAHNGGHPNPNPSKPLKDKGCGGKSTAGTLGEDLFTDLAVK